MIMRNAIIVIVLTIAMAICYAAYWLLNQIISID